MNTLELMVEKVLKENGYIAHKAVIESAADYIDSVNEMKEDNESIYTPEQWLKDTKKFSDEDLLFTKLDGCLEICYYLARQREQCLDETGCQLHYEDLRETFECEEFDRRFGKYGLDLNYILNFLLIYFQKEGYVNESDLI